MSNLYQKSMAVLDSYVPRKFQPFWQHPAAYLKKFPNKILQTKNDRKVMPLTDKIQILDELNCGSSATFIASDTTASMSHDMGLVIAGVSDLARPAEAISIPQTAALAATGIIWSRYSVVIIPKNYSLLSVNIFIAVTQSIQMYRACRYQMSQRA